LHSPLLDLIEDEAREEATEGSVLSPDRNEDEVSDEVAEGSLLCRQVFPLDSSEAETQWILSHDCSQFYAKQGVSVSALSRHVEKLLGHCFPSLLLRNNVIPVFGLSPQSSFNFRALMMPQRRYFSFRREGQILSNVCANEGCSSDSSDMHWTLGFSNSSFAGEFSESLVQALYLCPMIIGLSFSKVAESARTQKSQTGRRKSGEDGAILATLCGSLPPWISCLTFDGVLNDRDMSSMVAILEALGRLSSTQDIPAAQKDPMFGDTQVQGKFWFFAIRRSPDIKTDSWESFLSLLGRTGLPDSTPTQTILSSLKILDLSGNKLGDELCAKVLALIHDKDSGCRVKQLDLSGRYSWVGLRLSILSLISQFPSISAFFRRQSHLGRDCCTESAS
jgi:hypothetical protein